MLQYFLSRNLNSKQSVKLSILLTLSRYFTKSKMCVYVRLDFFFRWVFNNNEEEKIDKTVFLLLAFLQANYEELHLSKDSSDSFCLTVRHRQYLGQGWTLPAVPGTRLNSACGTWDKAQVPYSYSALDTATVTAGTITVIWEPGFISFQEFKLALHRILIIIQNTTSRQNFMFVYTDTI